MDRACSINVDPGVMMAVDAPLDVLEEKLAGNEGVYITNINSPHQLVAGGDTEKIKELGRAQAAKDSAIRFSASAWPFIRR